MPVASARLARLKRPVSPQLSVTSPMGVRRVAAMPSIEWNSYRALDLAKVKKLLKAPIVVDLRNIYRPDEMAQFGFNYTSLGRPRTI